MPKNTGGDAGWIKGKYAATSTHHGELLELLAELVLGRRSGGGDRTSLRRRPRRSELLRQAGGRCGTGPARHAVVHAAARPDGVASRGDGSGRGVERRGN